MADVSKKSRSPYIARNYKVFEVTLVGDADPDFWVDYLRPLGLEPQVIAGQVQVLLSATRQRWMGIPFRELTCSIVTCDGREREARLSAFLVAGFNSSRPLAYLEKTLFQTPYDQRAVVLEEKAPAFEMLGDGGRTLLRARLADRPPAQRIQDEVWEGAIYLPNGAGKGEQAERLFHARLSGEADVYPFDPRDELKFEADPRLPFLKLLINSHLTGKEWHIKRGATHARGRTLVVR